MTPSLEEMIHDWKERIDIRQKAHFHAAKEFEKWHYLIGVPTIICTTLAGATLFKDISNTQVKIVIGTIGLIGGILSAIQTFYSHAKRGEQHRTSAAKLGRVRHEIEIFEQFIPQRKEEREKKIREISDAIAKIDEDAPVVGSISRAILNKVFTLEK